MAFVMQRVLRGVVGGLVAGGVVFGAGVSASGAESVPGDWYFEVYGVQESLDAGFDGSGVTVAVIDLQVNPEVPTLQGVDLTVADPFCRDESGAVIPAVSTVVSDAAHGTNSVSLVAGTGAGYPGQIGVRGAAPGAKVLFYSGGRDTAGRLGFVECDDESLEPASYDVLFEQALDDGADIITIQVGSSPVDSALVARAVREGVIVLQGLSNEQVVERTGAGLAGMNGVVGVQAIDAFGNLQNGPDSTDTSVDVAAPGVGLTAQGGPGEVSWEVQTVQSGTSNATPFTAGVLAAVWSKYPEATGNQLLQSLVRNTGTEDHALSRDDGFGYGIVSLRHMLAVDPTQYDDVNPLVVDERTLDEDEAWLVEPRYEEIFPGQQAGDQPATGRPAAGLPGWVVPVVISAVLGVLLLAGVIVLVVVLATRGAASRQIEKG
ncbi:S8 family peptidase [Agromyces larvae]|uniref:S8 family peptidase n=1 Tax=Agromyces larvae TaxID=2929802 RepID=A0ABY4BXK3_9MICO|nr:S8 family serine peptidase [Agromyces larvae]UOE43947.1 S8 family peptidase [Agromyces larvae]